MKRFGLATAVIGVLLFSGGLRLGLASVQRNGLICGSAFSNDNSYPRPDLAKGQTGVFFGSAENLSDCRSALSTRREFSLAIAIPGGILIAVGLIVSRRDQAAT